MGALTYTNCLASALNSAQAGKGKELLGHGFGGDVPGSGVLARGPYGEDCLLSSLALPQHALCAEHHQFTGKYRSLLTLI